MRRIERIIVSALIFSKDGKILMGKKDPKEGGVYKNSWHMPGGGVDVNEDKEKALVREIKEETGIDISKSKVELIDDKGEGESEKTLETGEKVIAEMHFNVYKVNLDKDGQEIEVRPSDDLVQIEWFSLQDLSKMNLTPPSIALFKKLGFLS